MIMKVVISKQMESKNDERDRIRINGNTGFFLSLLSVKDTSVFFFCGCCVLRIWNFKWKQYSQKQQQWRYFI